LGAGDRIEKLDYASRWMRDGLETVSNRAGFFVCVTSTPAPCSA
jgi:hypothetical protein